MNSLSEMLERFGLTEYEAKTLSTLFQLSEAQAPEISRQAQVPKTRVYDVLEKLIEKKLVIEINGRPKKYKVLAPQQTFAQLIAGKKEELQSLESEALALQAELTLTVAESGETGERVLKVKDKNDFVKIVGQEIEHAKNEIIGFTALGKKFPVIGESLRRAAKNNVSVRLIHASDLSEAALSEFEKQGVNLKNADHGLNALVIDGHKVVLFLSDANTEHPEYHFTIWPKNPHMAAMVKHYFEHHWDKHA